MSSLKQYHPTPPDVVLALHTFFEALMIHGIEPPSSIRFKELPKGFTGGNPDIVAMLYVHRGREIMLKTEEK
jgi:hypothetical protein